MIETFLCFIGMKRSPSQNMAKMKRKGVLSHRQFQSSLRADLARPGVPRGNRDKRGAFDAAAFGAGCEPKA